MNTVAIPVLEKAKPLDNHLELLEAIPESAILVDSSGLIVATNAQLEKLFGYTRKELQGSHIELLIPEPLHAQHIKKRDQFIKSPRNQIMGDGKYIVVLISALFSRMCWKIFRTKIVSRSVLMSGI
jgi:PAS domain-containing protein